MQVVNVKENGVIVFVYQVCDFECYGVVDFDCLGWVLSIEEKFVQFKFDFVVIGLYFYDEWVLEIVRSIKFLLCGEFEIIDLNNVYLEEGVFDVQLMCWGFVWFDIGMYESMLDVSLFIQIIEQCQGFKVVLFEEIVWWSGWILIQVLFEQVEWLKKNQYGKYFIKIVQEKVYG